jgi:hypothetical protein
MAPGLLSDKNRLEGSGVDRAREIDAENCTVVQTLDKVPPMNTRTLSSHVLKALAAAQSEGRTSSLETLTEDLRVRRTDIRRTVSALHREGYVDALRMRLTLAGFAIAHSLRDEPLPALRKAPAVAAVVAA